MNKYSKPARIAATAVLATLSLVGVGEAVAAPGTTRANAGPRSWCC